MADIEATVTPGVALETDADGKVLITIEVLRLLGLPRVVVPAELVGLITINNGVIKLDNCYVEFKGDTDEQEIQIYVGLTEATKALWETIDLSAL